MFLLVIILRQAPDKACVMLAPVGVKRHQWRGVGFYRTFSCDIVIVIVDQGGVSIRSGGIESLCSSSVHCLGTGLLGQQAGEGKLQLLK